MSELRINDIVRPAGDGEDPLSGRIIKHTDARLRVIAAWGDRVEVVVVRAGGAFRRGRMELLRSDVVPAAPIPLPAPRTVKAHER